jgi:hypothetical protein
MSVRSPAKFGWKAKQYRDGRPPPWVVYRVSTWPFFVVWSRFRVAAIGAVARGRCAV